MLCTTNKRKYLALESLPRFQESKNARHIIAGLLVEASAISLTACGDSDPTKVTVPPSISTAALDDPERQSHERIELPSTTLQLSEDGSLILVDK